MKQNRLKLVILLILAGAVGLALGFWVNKPAVKPPQNTISNKQNVVEAPKRPLTILFGGDIFLDRSIRRTIEVNSFDYLWQNVSDFLKSYPNKVANLEGPVVQKATAAPTGSFSFAFQPEYVKDLQDSFKFTAVSLANNHTANQGAAGLIKTRQKLDSLGLKYFGDPDNAVAQSFLTTELDGKKIALVGEHDVYSSTNQAAIDAKIKELKQAGFFVIAFPHWGVEYNLGIPAIEQTRAHEIIDAGADLIIASHPHVVQPVEIYKGKAIFYSLGNFLFDQGFSYDTLHGLLVAVTFEDNGALKFNLFPTEQNATYQVSLAADAAKQKMLNRISQTSVVPAEVKENLVAGEFEVPAP